ncbi:MAG: hypothetical protein PHQ58_13090 [Rhodoferax sp.]|uniref:hypothetical protein n=1 Tax=Rhodoferax sp. TaxID=50421 RepID=UPI002606FB42|nr:hypothetical protein [Rhodoferax sp.]MDD2881363.1 hypothetical protein [Rhodoferax sp.]
MATGIGDDDRVGQMVEQPLRVVTNIALNLQVVGYVPVDFIRIRCDGQDAQRPKL